jgi:hypothetical protein
MIVIPMAGASSRFTRAGYTVKKYRLMAHGHSMFAWSVCSFQAQFAHEDFLFICLAEDGARPFIEEECARIGLARYRIVELPSFTKGQADTVHAGLLADGSATSEQPITIFNIDTIRSEVRIPPDLFPMDGYVETFRGEGSAWSFVVPGPAHSVLQTTEKVRVSDQCSTGLYYFGSCRTFCRFYEQVTAAPDEFEKNWGEHYIAPLYNLLIQAGLSVKYSEVPMSEIAFAGTPDEYEAFKASPNTGSGKTPRLGG